MRMRFLVSVFFTVLYLSGFAFAECSFTSRDSSCEVFSDSFNVFDLNFEDVVDLENFSVRLYEKERPINSIVLDVDYSNFKVRNLNPFTVPGVYVLDILYTNNAGNEFTLKKEFLFDNLRPNLPVVPINLDSSQSSIFVLGEAKFAERVVILNKGGVKVAETDVLEGGTFSVDLSLVAGLNFFKFYSVGVNGLKSDVVERVVMRKSSFDVDLNPSVSEIVIDDNSVVNGVVDFMTLKRNFYVSGGVGAPNARVFISGAPVVADGSGKFGGFVNLNFGENEIVVLSGGESKSFNIKYVEPKFHFTGVSVDKFVDKGSVVVNVGTDYDTPFDVFLNGEFIESKVSVDNEISFSVTGLKKGRNYIFLKGFNGAEVLKVVYYDSEGPNVFEHVPEFVVDGKLFFSAKDDFGIDFDKTNLRLNSELIENDLLVVSGDYFFYEIENLSEGKYDFSLKVFDNVGKFKEISGEFRVDYSRADFYDVEISNGVLFGDKFIFSNLNDVRVVLKPNRNVAFDRIFMNNDEQVDYKIAKDNSVSFNLKFYDTFGSLNLKYIDKSGDFFSKDFFYEVVEKPVVELDFIDNPVLGLGEVYRIFGKVSSSIFDWDAFVVNGLNAKRMGEFFEAYVVFDSEKSNFNLVGRDFVGSELSFVMNGEFVDVDDVSFIFDEDKDFGVDGVNNDFRNAVLNFVRSYDGISFEQVLPSSFTLASAQRSGLRSLNLKGVSSSKVGFSDISKISYDGLNPEIYFFEDRSYAVGTLSEVSRVLVNGEEVSLGGKCSEEVFGEFCREFRSVSGSDVVKVFDSSKNFVERRFLGSYDLREFSDLDLDLFFTGNDMKVLVGSSFISGQFVSNERPRAVYANNNSCLFDEYNFVCFVDIVDGDNKFMVKVETLQSSKVKEIVIEGVSKDSNLGDIELIGIGGEEVYEVLGSYYFSSGLVNFNGTASRKNLVKLMINNEEFLVGERAGKFEVLDMDLDSFVSGKDGANLEVGFEVEDEFGNKKRSNTFSLVYTRVLNMIVDIFVS